MPCVSSKTRQNNRLAVLYALAEGNDPKCENCGFDDIRALHIDHKDGGGCREANKYKNNRPKYYKDMLSHLEDFQILCANCNAIKLYEERENSRSFDLPVYV